MSDSLNCGNVNEISPPKKANMIVLAVDGSVFIVFFFQGNFPFFDYNSVKLPSTLLYSAAVEIKTVEKNETTIKD